MKSTNVMIAAMASTAIAQPHAHQHAHLHPARLEHQHHHDKRVLETEVVVEWVTETVIEMIEGTTTEWVTEPATGSPTTLSTVVASATTDGGQFFETASTSEPTSTTTPVAVAQPVEPTTTSSAVYVAPTTEPAPTTSAYVAPVEPVEPTTSTTSTEAPVVVAPTTTSEAAAATTTAAATSSGSTSISGTDFTGKLTWIGDTTGAYSACGVPYEANSMFVAVNPSVLDCGADGQGSPMTITANGKTVSAVAIDKCMGCDTTHIDVASAVWTALGYTFDDGGMHDNPGLSWVLSATK